MKTPAAPALIGIAGRAGVGKDTLAQWISHRYGHRVQAYADPLRTILNQRFGWTADMWENRAWKEAVDWKNGCGNFSPRDWMQWLGTDILRQYAGYDIFVKLAFQRWDRAPYALVMSDIRFNNEAQAIVDRGGFVIELRREAAGPVRSHVSESGVDPKLFHGVLTNDSTLSDLFLGARTLLEAEGSQRAVQLELDLGERQA